MTGLMQRIRRRRQQPPAPVEPQPAVPAGVEPQDTAAPARPSFRERGRLRRRLRYLRRVRELGFRDIGGLVFDLQRFGRSNEELVKGKIAALEAVDHELRALETALDDRHDIVELREPGIAACPRCGALHGSEARFCPACGIELRGPRALGEVGAATPQFVAATTAATPTPAPAVQQHTAAMAPAPGDALGKPAETDRPSA